MYSLINIPKSNGIHNEKYDRDQITQEVKEEKKSKDVQHSADGRNRETEQK